MTEWLSRTDEGFYEQSGKWSVMLENETNQTNFKWETEDCMSVAGAINAFRTAYKDYKVVNSTKNRIAKDEAKKIAMSSMREFASSSVRYNKRMDEASRFQLGIRPRDTTPSTHQRPTSQPTVIVENTVNYFEHHLKASNNETRSTARPSDAYGVRFAWQVGGERPASGADLPKSRFNRRTAITVGYSEADSGKSVYYAACYENARGEAGPWSPIVEAHIR